MLMYGRYAIHFDAVTTQPLVAFGAVTAAKKRFFIERRLSFEAATAVLLYTYL